MRARGVLCFHRLQFRAQFFGLGGDRRRGRHGESDDQAEKHGTGLRCPSDTPGCKAWKHGSEVSRRVLGLEHRFGPTRGRCQSTQFSNQLKDQPSLTIATGQVTPRPYV